MKTKGMSEQSVSQVELLRAIPVVRLLLFTVAQHDFL